MTLLISVMVILLLAVAALLFYPWKGQTNFDRDAMNQAFYRARLGELDADNAPIDVTARVQMENDLQQNLLDDIPPEPARPAARTESRWIVVPGLLVLVALSIGIYWKTGASDRVLALQAAANQVPQLLARVMDPRSRPLSEAELTRLGQGLRARLQSDPNNRAGWSILGRIGMARNNPALASQAFEKAYRLAPENMEATLDYAEVLTRVGDALQQQQAGNMLSGLLKSNTDNPRVLSLLAFNAYQQQHYAEAIKVWQRLLNVMPAGDSRRDAIAKSIEQAKVASGIDKSRVAISIELSALAQHNLPQHGAIFVSIGDGQSPVPVVAKKIPLGHFPVTVSLDDSNAMMPGRLLSSLSKGEVNVHISTSETVTPQPGDWFGHAVINQFNASEPIKVMIAQQQP